MLCILITDITKLARMEPVDLSVKKAKNAEINNNLHLHLHHHHLPLLHKTDVMLKSRKQALRDAQIACCLDAGQFSLPLSLLTSSQFDDMRLSKESKYFFQSFCPCKISSHLFTNRMNPFTRKYFLFTCHLQFFTFLILSLVFCT